MIMNEIFDKPQKVYINNPSAPHFYVDGKEYVVQFIPDQKFPIQVEVRFGIVDEEADRPDMDNPTVKYAKMGTGNELKVLSSVLHIIKQYAASRPEVQVLRFTADHKEASRVKLYDRLVSSMAKGWHHGAFDAESGVRVYTLVRQQEDV